MARGGSSHFAILNSTNRSNSSINLLFQNTVLLLDVAALTARTASQVVLAVSVPEREDRAERQCKQDDKHQN